MEITEETRNKIYVDYCEKNRNTVIYGFRSARYLHFKAGMNAAVNYILSQSLAQRITGPEKGEIQKLFYAAEGGTTEYSRGYSDALKRIFGKEILDNNSK